MPCIAYFIAPETFHTYLPELLDPARSDDQRKFEVFFLMSKRGMDWEQASLEYEYRAYNYIDIFDTTSYHNMISLEWLALQYNVRRG